MVFVQKHLVLKHLVLDSWFISFLLHDDYLNKEDNYNK